MTPVRILFLCHGNIFRSAFAHHRLLALLSRNGSLQAEVRSAGTKARPGEPSPAIVLEGALAYDLDLSTHTASLATKELLDWATRIYVMQKDMQEAVAELCPAALPRTRLLGELDPAGGDPQIPDVGGDKSPEASVAARFARIEQLLGLLIAQESLASGPPPL